MVATPCDTDTIGVIELELLKLVRHLETFGRRSSLYLRVDRAGYLALRTLEAQGPLSTKALAGTLHLDASTVTRQVTALESEGFVERRPDPTDRRSSTILLTAEGRRTMEGVEQERRRRMQSLIGDWSEEERVTLGLILNRLNASLLENDRSTRELS
ncbi:MAG: MarR family winged helix-turn-helix transcriptional regulator [Acidimicrobiales bacterium]